MTIQDILSAVSSLMWGYFMLIPLLIWCRYLPDTETGLYPAHQTVGANRLAFP